MRNNRMDFTIQDAGCLLWLAPSSLGGLTPAQFGQAWMDPTDDNSHDLIARAAFMPMGLYQDDGYRVRLVEGALTEAEETQWTAHVGWKLQVPCGKILVSGSLSEDFENELSNLEKAVDGGAYWAGCYVLVPAGEYQVDVYSYPPGDLSAGWGHITNPKLFGQIPGIEPERKLDYFRRTRPNEAPPAWMQEDYEETDYINFIIQLRPNTAALEMPMLESDGCLAWEFRKPAVCPIGIPS